MLPQERRGREQNEETVKAGSIWEIPHEDEVPLFRALSISKISPNLTRRGSELNIVWRKPG